MHFYRRVTTELQKSLPDCQIFLSHPDERVFIIKLSKFKSFDLSDLTVKIGNSHKYAFATSKCIAVVNDDLELYVISCQFGYPKKYLEGFGYEFEKDKERPFIFIKNEKLMHTLLSCQ